MAGYRVFKQGKYRMDVLGQPLDEAVKVTLDYKVPVTAAIFIVPCRKNGIDKLF